jgi:hypothetical protein
MTTEWEFKYHHILLLSKHCEVASEGSQRHSAEGPHQVGLSSLMPINPPSDQTHLALHLNLARSA